MSYKLLVLAPSAGGKSTLMRYLRGHTDINVAESDELVTAANNGAFPDDKLKNEHLIPETSLKVFAFPSVVYIASFVPEALVELARSKGFKIVLLDMNLSELSRRNSQRMQVERYPDASPWFKMQLEAFASLQRKGLIDVVIDGKQPTEMIADRVLSLSQEF